MAFSFRVGTKWCHDFPKLAKESGFYFNMDKSRVRVDWNRISSIDVDRVVRERDFLTVDENVNNVIDYCLESECDVKILDANFVKLFRLAQLAVEYLLYCKQYLDHSVVILKDELRLKIEENVKLKKELMASEEIIKSLKEKSREKYKLLETKIGDSNGEIHKCPHCPKTFVSAMFVNAHVARRHSYVNEVHLFSPSVPDHYRIETEKLHTEIKMLKERLNQTERVIRIESDKISDSTRMETEKKTNKPQENSNNNTEKIQEQKQYHEELSSLKNILLDEIHNLKQREKPVYETTTETNLKTLISQQEKEIQRLRNQLLERLTPDVESMQLKLRTQEDYWKSKIEQLEHQHRLDIDKLTAELKLTQQKANHIKAEYESKVSDLQRESLNQSNILTEQSKQLSSLSREISSQNQEQKSTEANVKQFCGTTELHRDIINNKSENVSFAYKHPKTVENDKIIIEDVESVSSQESNDRLISVLPKNYVHTEKQDLDEKIEFYHDNNTEKSRDSRKMFEDINAVEKTDQVNNHQIKVSKERLSNSFRDTSNEKKSIQNVQKTFVNPVKDFENSVNEANDMQSSSEVLKDEESSKSESISTSESTSESDVQSDTSSEEESPRHRITQPEFEHLSQTKTMNLKELRENIQETLNKRLRDLGIDPEWDSLPKVTFQQKMEIVKQHQNINSKKMSKYNHIKRKIIDEVLRRVSAKQRDTKDYKPIKSSPLDKLVTNVKSKAMKAFNIQKSADNQEHLKIQTTPSRRLHLKHKIDLLPKRINETDTKKLLSTKNEGKTNPNSGLNLVPSYKNTSQQSKLSPSIMKSKDSIKTLSSQNDNKTFMKNSFSDIKSLYHTDSKTSTPKRQAVDLSESYETNDSESLIMHQTTAQDILVSPKSVLKTAGSTGSLAKKKVFFDLDQTDTNSLDLNTKELHDDNWNVSRFSDERGQELQKSKSLSTGNIILKTTQSEKIAEISKKIEAQLSMARHKPAGSIETVLSKYLRDKETLLHENHELSSTSITSSILGSPILHTDRSPKSSSSKFPQPAPRNMKNSHSKHLQQMSTKDSDLDSDIDEILRIE